MADSDIPEVQRYIVLRQFVSHEGTHYQGEKLPKRYNDDPIWKTALYYLVSAGYLYPVAANDSYDRLPVHIFTAVKTQQELDGVILVGESPVSFNEWVKADEVTRIEELNAAEAASVEENRRRTAQRAEEQHKVALRPFVEANPIIVPHKIPAIDAMHDAAERAGENKNSDAAERGDDVENQDEHAMGRPPEHQVEVSNAADGADVRDQEHTPAEQTEGPDADEATPVVPSTEGDGADVKEPTRSTYEGESLKDLQERAHERGLTKTGNKAELVERLRKDDIEKD